jgi:hypothetical protein
MSYITRIQSENNQLILFTSVGRSDSMGFVLEFMLQKSYQHTKWYSLRRRLRESVCIKEEVAWQVMVKRRLITWFTQQHSFTTFFFFSQIVNTNTWGQRLLECSDWQLWTISYSNEWRPERSPHSPSPLRAFLARLPTPHQYKSSFPGGPSIANCWQPFQTQAAENETK